MGLCVEVKVTPISYFFFKLVGLHCTVRSRSIRTCLLYSKAASHHNWKLIDLYKSTMECHVKICITMVIELCPFSILRSRQGDEKGGDPHEWSTILHDWLRVLTLAPGLMGSCADLPIWRPFVTCELHGQVPEWQILLVFSQPTPPPPQHPRYQHRGSRA